LIFDFDFGFWILFTLIIFDSRDISIDKEGKIESDNNKFSYAGTDDPEYDRCLAIGSDSIVHGDMPLFIEYKVGDGGEAHEEVVKVYSAGF
jgi:hypothetical protein